MAKRQIKFDQSGELGKRLRQERLKSGLNQSDFAALAETSLQSQMRYETGQQMPKLEYLFALAPNGVDIGFVVTGIRKNGDFGYFETELINNFCQLNDQQRSALLMAAEAMADPRSQAASPVDPPLDQLQAAFTIAQALTSWQMPDGDEFMADIRRKLEEK
jgi:transcriptional regulator with XRE-family HTH domain